MKEAVFVLIICILSYRPYTLAQSILKSVSPTSDSLTLIYSPPYIISAEDDIFLYEIYQRSIFSSKWDVINTSPGEHPLQVLHAQIVSVRVDSNRNLTSGTFQLGVDWSGRLNSEDMVTVTSRIVFNADRKSFKVALEILPNVIVRSVIRCDETDTADFPRFNSINYGIKDCPHQSRGGYSWLIVFESLGSIKVPNLFVAGNHLGDLWTGIGPQISIIYLSEGRVTPSICVDGVCQYRVSKLEQSTPYSFKIRALISSSVWTDYSTPSEFVTTLEERVPSRPRAPILSSITNAAIILSVTRPITIQGVSSIESQYRRLDVPLGKWKMGPVLNLNLHRFKNNLILNTSTLDEGVYQVRIRLLNIIGYSPYSSPCEMFTVSNLSLSVFATATATKSSQSAQNVLYDSNSLKGSNNSFSRISSIYPKKMQNSEFLGPSVTCAATGHTPARIHDFYYSPGVGVGGTQGLAGGHGLCVAILFNERLQQPFSLRNFIFTGAAIDYEVPGSDPVEGVVTMITFRCWGAGGGAGGLAGYNNSNLTDMSITSYTNGGGGAFAEATVSVEVGDILTVIIAGGGTSSVGQLGGKGGYGGGADGGRGYDGAADGGGGGGGGGGTSTVTRRGILLVAAGGGGGAGSSHDCCANGGGAGGALGSSGSVPTLGFADASLSSVGKGYPMGEALGLSDYIVEPYIQTGSLSAVAALSGTGGSGGGAIGGIGGLSGRYFISSTGSVSVVESGTSAVFDQVGSFVMEAFPGISGVGGVGGAGLHGGGGGGGGLFGGGGGGSGVNGAGGGGGSSYAITSLARAASVTINCSIVVDYVNNTCVYVTVDLPITQATSGVTQFLLEGAEGYTADDFHHVGSILPTSGIKVSLTNTVGVHTVCGLISNTMYSVRAIPYVASGRLHKSNRATFKTLSDPFNNYWEPIVPRRLSQAGIGRGFAYSATNYPNLDVGVEVFTKGTTATNSDGTARYTDPSTSKQPAYPSARQGHTLSTFRGKVYMFGGRSSGYSCAYGYTDMLNMGSTQSGREIYPCVNYQPEMQDLWTLDLVTYEWILITFLNSTYLAPPPREQHSAIIVNNYLYIFGGKTEIFLSANTTADKFVSSEKHFYNDLWKLELPTKTFFSLNYSKFATNYSVGPENSEIDSKVFIFQDEILYLSINGSEDKYIRTEGSGYSPRNGKCIDSIQVRVIIDHTCINQLKLFLRGPGDLTGSFNYQPQSSNHDVILFDTPETNGTGCSSGRHDFIFDDISERLSYECCTNVFSGIYQPNGKISEFLGFSTSAEWVLIVQDTVNDFHIGYVVSWGIDFVVSDCYYQYNWINITINSEISSVISPRYHVNSLVYGSSIFFFGGRDSYHSPLADLNRFDTISESWVQLIPVSFGDTFFESSSMGFNLVLTPYGLLRFGGYLRISKLNKNHGQYLNSVSILDPLTLRWSELYVSDWGLHNGSASTLHPPGRYLSAMTFVSRKQISFVNVKTTINSKNNHYRTLFDLYSDSTHTNYIGDIADSMFLHGGFNGAVGRLRDGSGVGNLGDSWMLRLSNFSTNVSSAAQQLYLRNSCTWRFFSTTPVPFSSPKIRDTCLGNSSSLCSLRELLILSWCSANYQAV